ncbi:MAG: arsinothricin resistance N-acetyltransferase ArsN1 family A [Trueperaceae bacterium]
MGTKLIASVRPATLSDAGFIAAIYNEGIRDRIATFETRERTKDEVAAWIGDAQHPVLVSQLGAEVVAWAAASSYRPRECYAGIAEFSIYVAREARGQGIGQPLLEAFLAACRSAGFWKVVSRVFPENLASRALLKACGFREVGVYEKHAMLDGEWRDVVIVERLIAV